jgi:hypothetical protein
VSCSQHVVILRSKSGCNQCLASLQPRCLQVLRTQYNHSIGTELRLKYLIQNFPPNTMKMSKNYTPAPDHVSHDTDTQYVCEFLLVAQQQTLQNHDSKCTSQHKAATEDGRSQYGGNVPASSRETTLPSPPTLNSSQTERFLCKSCLPARNVHPVTHRTPNATPTATIKLDNKSLCLWLPETHAAALAAA